MAIIFIADRAAALMDMWHRSATAYVSTVSVNDSHYEDTTEPPSLPDDRQSMHAQGLSRNPFPEKKWKRNGKQRKRFK